MEKNYLNNSSLKEFIQYKENPFLDNLLIPKGKKNVVIGTSDKALYNKSTGELDNDTMFISIKKELDKDQFVKLFHSQLQVIFDLSKAALKVFGYIASITEYDDKVIFDLPDCKEYTNYNSTNAIYKGLTELVKAEMIARSNASNIYFINPQIFYKGDRLVLVTDYRKKKAVKIENPNQLSIMDVIEGTKRINEKMK